MRVTESRRALEFALGGIGLVDTPQLIVVIVVVILSIEKGAVSLFADLGEMAHCGRGRIGDESKSMGSQTRIRRGRGGHFDCGRVFLEFPGELVRAVAEVNCLRNAAPLDAQ